MERRRKLRGAIVRANTATQEEQVLTLMYVFIIIIIIIDQTDSTVLGATHKSKINDRTV